MSAINKEKEKLITQEMLKNILHYNPDTGIFIWIKRINRYSTIKLGQIAGYINLKGWRMIKIGVRYEYYAHRLAFLYMTGKWPENQIDHIDNNKSNNRWLNLRAANNSQNHRNVPKRKTNKSGYKGVYYAKDRGKWRALICINGKKINLGQFGTAIDAWESYCCACIKYHGEFARVA